MEKIKNIKEQLKLISEDLQDVDINQEVYGDLTETFNGLKSEASQAGLNLDIMDTLLYKISNKSINKNKLINILNKLESILSVDVIDSKPETTDPFELWFHENKDLDYFKKEYNLYFKGAVEIYTKPMAYKDWMKKFFE